MSERKHATVHICSLSSGLDDLSRRDQADDDVVLDVLRRKGRFSAFEASANDTIARTMTRLCRDRLTTSHECGYPWVDVLEIDGEPITKARGE